ncbi:MAG: hypothetical protein MUE52_06200 [Tabrizicola sp.]|jgi:hypothetical protein|nr:hypothetical protein [Tabrizicola sp.]
MRLPVIAVLALSANIAVPAQAFDVRGATVTLENRDNSELVLDQQHFTGDIELSFGAEFSLQLGVKNANYEEFGPGSFGSRGHEAHLIWRPQQVEGLALGAFVGEESFGNWWSFYGIEAKYQVAGFDAEAAIVDYNGPTEFSYSATHTTLELGYSFADRYRVFAGHTAYDEDGVGVWVTNTYVGGSARVYDGISIYGSFGTNDYDGGTDEDVVTLGLRYDFGGGVTFGQRSYTDLLPTN